MIYSGRSVICTYVYRVFSLMNDPTFVWKQTAKRFFVEKNQQ